MGYRETMIAKLGGEQQYLEWRKQISSKGGSRMVPKGLAKMDKEKLKEITSKGGKSWRKNKGKSST